MFAKSAFFRSRFIPACVGNSTRRNEMSVRVSVHPRVCGELLPTNGSMRLYAGSSPRVWGTLLAQPEPLVRRRFIPACVGNS